MKIFDYEINEITGPTEAHGIFYREFEMGKKKIKVKALEIWAYGKIWGHAYLSVGDNKTDETFIKSWLDYMKKDDQWESYVEEKKNLESSISPLI